MKMLRGQNTYLLYITLFLIALFLIYVACLPANNKSFNNESPYDFGQDWLYENNNTTVSLPSTLPLSQNGSVRLSKKLPVQIETQFSSIGIFTSHQTLKAYIDNQNIYSSDKQQSAPTLSVSPGERWNIITLPKDAEGKIITLEFDSPYSKCIPNISSIYIGNKSSLFFFLQQKHLIILLLGVFMILFAFGYTIIYFLFHKALRKNKSIILLGIFSGLMGIYFVFSTNIMQIWINHSLFLYFAKNMVLLLFPLPIFHNIWSSWGFSHRKILGALTSILYFNIFTVILLGLFHVVDLYYSMPYSIIIEILCCFAVMILLLLEYIYDNDNNILITIIALDTFGFFALLGQFVKTEHISFPQIGALCFLIIMSLKVVNVALYTIGRSKQTIYFKRLATLDMLTGLKNRTAYIHDCDNLTVPSPFAVIIADLNFLKTINDSYGHKLGDHAIISASKVLKNSLHEVVSKRQYECYRIGGDEFACILKNTTESEITYLCEQIQKNIASVNKDLSYVFQLAVGYALFDEEKHSTYHEVEALADSFMYRNKTEQKTTFLE